MSPIKKGRGRNGRGSRTTGRLDHRVEGSTAPDGRDFGYQPVKTLADGVRCLTYGTRSDVPDANRATMIAKDREYVRQYLEPHVDSYLMVLLADMNDRGCIGHNAAMRAVPELMGYTGLHERVLEQLLEQIGLVSHTQLIMAARMFIDSQRVTLRDAEREAVKVIRACVKADPTRRDSLMRQCFGGIVDTELLPEESENGA